MANVFVRKEIPSGKTVTFSDDIKKYSNVVAVELQAQAQRDFLRNGLYVVGGIYAGTAAAVVGFVAADAIAATGVATIMLNGAATSVEVIKGAGVSAYVAAKSTTAQLAKLVEGAIPIIRATLTNGRDILAAVLPG